VKTEFQAKEIQEMLGISHSRYTYLAKNIGISPDIELGEGRGKMHLYSFRNALQFAFAHHLNAMGCIPRAVQWILALLDMVAEKGMVPLYEPARRIDGKIEFLARADRHAARLSGELNFSKWPSMRKERMDLIERLERAEALLREASNRGDERSVAERVTELQFVGRQIRETTTEDWQSFMEEMDPYSLFKGLAARLEECEAYQTLNVGVIKEKVMEYTLKE
jgi:hypothetical protein